VLVYNFADLRLLHSIETLSNPTGIIALSAAAEQTTLACPGLHAGQVRRRCTDAFR
jgi:WD repeat-containing protein 45